MIILGTKFFGHDSTICKIDTDRQTIFALTTERYTRRKHDSAPVAVMREYFENEKINIIAHSFNDFSETDFCLESKAEGAARAIESFLDSSFAKNHFDSELLNRYLDEIRSEATRVSGSHESEIFNGKYIAKAIESMVNPSKEASAKLEFFDHHLCHAVSAYYSSPYLGKPSLVLTLDGQGDGYFGKTFIFRDGTSQQIGASPVYDMGITGSYSEASIGSIYSNFTASAGFRRNSDEGKIEALAAFGEPVLDVLQEMKDACTITQNSIFISPQKIAKFYDNDYLSSLIEKYGRENYCATVQTFLEDTVTHYINSLDIPSDVDSLCLSGGVVANIIMNLNIYERTKFNKIHVTPFMGDEGTAYGAAILAAQLHGADVSWINQKKMPYFGPSYSKQEVMSVLKRHWNQVAFTDLGDEWPVQAAKEVAGGSIIAVFQGALEFGPRALGNRSILANPADKDIREKINLTIKRRPPWQPFCPSILESEREKLFQDSFPHKYMATAFRMKDEFIPHLPSAAHVDGTARPQFVSEQDNPDYFKLLTEVKKHTGFGVVINTSFNLHGRAMVMSPEHALQDMLDCNLDALFIEGFRVTKKPNNLEANI